MLGMSKLSPKNHLPQDSLMCRGVVIMQEALEILKRQRI